MIFFLKAKRPRVAELLLGRFSLAWRPSIAAGLAEVPAPDAEGVTLVWSEDPSSGASILPTVVVTPDGDARDWGAWLVTYATALRPYSAFFRVIRASDFAILARNRRAPTLGSISSASVGLILGEVLSSSEVLARTREPINASTCESTLAFALLRKIAVSQQVLDEADSIAAGWTLARGLSRQRERELSPQEVIRVAKIIQGLAANSMYSEWEDLQYACLELATNGSVHLNIAVFGSFLSRAAREMDGTREERVAVFEKALEFVMESPVETHSAFSIGYLASRINPGTMSHSLLLAPVLKRHPSAMLWYGVCAGLANQSSLLTEFGGIGRRVLRDLLSPDDLLERPRTDIGLPELAILATGGRVEPFSVTSSSQITIEIEPSVWTVVNWPPRSRARKGSEANERPDRTVWLEQEIAAAIARLSDVYRRIRAEEGTDLPPREHELNQPTLFDRRPGRPGTKKE